MNNHTRNAIADSALDIFKAAVLLVLYERTDVKTTPYPPQGRVLKPRDISKALDIPYVPNPSADAYALVYGTLDQLALEGHAYRYLNYGWAITEQGASLIES